MFIQTINDDQIVPLQYLESILKTEWIEIDRIYQHCYSDDWRCSLGGWGLLPAPCQSQRPSVLETVGWSVSLHQIKEEINGGSEIISEFIFTRTRVDINNCVIRTCVREEVVMWWKKNPFTNLKHKVSGIWFIDGILYEDIRLSYWNCSHLSDHSNEH